MAHRTHDSKKQPSSVIQQTIKSTSSLPSSRPFTSDSSQTVTTPGTVNGGQNSTLSSLSQFPIQGKLNIGEPNDKYEQEADRVASEVVQRIQNGTIAQPLDDNTISPIRRSPVQRDNGIISGSASNEFENQLNQARQGGRSLEPDVRGQMESAIGADFSGVKVHNDVQSDQLNRSIQAKAFTTGQDVFFKQGAYNPGSRSGQELIAHELTHVVQQGAPTLQQKTETTQNHSLSKTVQQEPLSLQRKPQIPHVGPYIQRDGDGLLDKVKNFFKPSPVPEEQQSLLSQETSQDETEQSNESTNLVNIDTGDDDLVEINSDSIKITIGDREYTLSRSQVQAKTEAQKEFGVSNGYQLAFTVPIGPLAPLALGFNLSFDAGANATLTFTGEVVGSSSDASLHLEGEGKAGANVSAGAGVGVGVTSGIASATCGANAKLTAEAEGSLKVEGDVATNSNLVNSGTQATINLSGAIKAAIEGAITLSVAIFSKDFSVTLKEWTLGNANWNKTIMDIGQKDSFLPTKSDLGMLDDKTKDIFKALDPAPTSTQKKWIAKLYADYNTAVASARELQKEGVDIEEPTFWDVVDSYEEQKVYKIINKRIVEATGLEVMPLMTTHLMEQMEVLSNIDE